MHAGKSIYDEPPLFVGSNLFIFTLKEHRYKIGYTFYYNFKLTCKYKIRLSAFPLSRS